MNICKLIQDKRIKTPAYIWDIDMLDEHVNKACTIAEEIGKGKVELCYAMKANPLFTKCLSEKMRHIEVCSPGEFEICKTFSIPGDKIILSGVNKDSDLIRDAIEYGVDIITVESLRQYTLIKEHANSNKSIVRILPRLSNGAQFGMSEEDIEYVIEDSINVPQLNIIGIHFFSGTQKKNIDKDIEEIDNIVEFVEKLHQVYEFEPELLEYGPGLKVPYFTGDDFDSLYDDFSTLIGYIAGLELDYTVGVELGRFFAFNSMVYITAVDDIKRINDVNICIVDGGIHHINYYGQNMAMRTPLIDHIRMNEKIVQENSNEADWRICGSLCTFADVLVRKTTFSELSIGDVLVFRNVGAYSMTESPALFLSRKLPYIYSYSEKDGLKMIRDTKDTYSINIGQI